MTRRWICAIAILAGLALLHGCGPASPPPPAFLGKPQVLKTLVTLKVPVQVIADAHKEDTTLWGLVKTRGVNVVVVARGDVLLGPALENARFVSKDEATHLVVWECPEPTALSPRVDMEHSYTFAVDKERMENITDSLTIAARDEAFRKGQQMIAEAGNSPEMIAQSKEQAELTLKELFKAVGWNLEVRWKKTH
jgi:hypothetical protein